MRLSDIRGQERSVSLLQSSLKRGRVHHAWLFSGAGGVGKETTATAFARALLCQGEVEGDSCGACSSCAKVDRGVHPDLLLLLPEAEMVKRGLLAKEDLSKAPSKELKTEQIRRLEAALALSPIESKRRVVLLLGADSMNVSAQNAFLKTLEEPPAGTHLILLAEAGDALLPTIRSRCIRVPFSLLPLDYIASRVVEETGADEGVAGLIAALSGGSLGAALSLTPESLAGRVEILEALEGLGGDDYRPLLALAERISAGGREAAEILLEATVLFYRDVALFAEGVDERQLANRDLLHLIEAAASRGALDALQRIRVIQEAIQAMRRYAIPRLAMERMLLSFVEQEAA